jgi:hypothetical protein
VVKVEFVGRRVVQDVFCRADKDKVDK